MAPSNVHPRRGVAPSSLRLMHRRPHFATHRNAGAWLAATEAKTVAASRNT
jgi:hypothetical protein